MVSQPYGILISIGSCWFFGFIIVVVLAACINPDLESVTGSRFGQPMAQASNLSSLTQNFKLLTKSLDLFRRHRANRYPLANVSPLHRAISHGPLYSRGSVSPKLGFLA